MINNYAPDLVISTGVAGGADVEMNVTDVIVGTSYCYHDAYCGSECSFGQSSACRLHLRHPKTS